MVITRWYFHVTRKPRKLRQTLGKGRKQLKLARATYRAN